ncbi:MAG: 2-hydroxyacyl-CoA dehydratase [Promethearchaeota archaeon]
MDTTTSERHIGPLEYLYQASITTRDLVNGAIPAQELRVFRTFLEGISSVLEDKIARLKEGKLLLGTHFAFPSEVFACFESVVPVCMETISYATSAFFTSGTERDYDRAIAFGHPYHTCTSQKGVIGMSLRENYFDLDAIAIPTAPCDNTMSSYQFFSEVKNVPTIVGDMPYYHDERGYEYFGNELRKMVDELATLSGEEPNYDALREAIGYSSRAVRALAEINDLRAVEPCPVESMFNPIGSCVQNFFAGRREKAEFYESVLEFTRERARTGERPWEGEERIRSVWPYMSVFFDVSLYEWMDRKLGMSNVCDAFNYFFFDPIDAERATVDEIFEGLAKQSMEYPMTRQSESFCDNFLDDAVFLSRKFKADCAIFSAHIGCKQSVSLIQMIRDVLKDELGIPMLTIELDIGDKRMTSAEAIKKRLTEFYQTLL